MSERLRKRIEALRVEYVKTFAEEAEGFEAELSLDNSEGIARRAHRIGGTAGSYQLNEICSAAQRVERLCEEQREQNHGSSLNDKSQNREVLAEAVVRLCEALRAV